MLRQQYSYSKDIETRKNQKLKKKRTIVHNLTEISQNLRFKQKMLTYDGVSKKCHFVFKTF